MEIRKYNADIDEYYSPDDTPNLFLTEEQVEEVLASIPKINEESELEAIEIIRKIEKLQRDEKLGEISNDECVKENDKISDYFLKKYGFWPYVTNIYKNFYMSFVKKIR